MTEYIELGFEFIEGKRKGSQVLWIPSEKQLYHKNTVSKMGRSYVCQEANCNSRVYMKADGTCVKLKNSVHCHGEREQKQYRTRVINEMKKMAQKDTRTSVRAIFDDVMSRYYSWSSCTCIVLFV